MLTDDTRCPECKRPMLLVDWCPDMREVCNASCPEYGLCNESVEKLYCRKCNIAVDTKD